MDRENLRGYPLVVYSYPPSYKAIPSAIKKLPYTRDGLS